MLNEILEAIKKAKAEGYRYFGIRGDDVKFEVGEELEPSYDWNHEYDIPSTEKLSGTCSTGIDYLWYDGEQEDLDTIEKAIKLNETYPYNYRTVIAGESAEYGEDEGELIISGAKVIYVIK